jgi:hypothetical protein
MKKIKLNKLQKEMLTAQVLTSRMVAGLDEVPKSCKLEKFLLPPSFMEIREKMIENKIIKPNGRKNND